MILLYEKVIFLLKNIPVKNISTKKTDEIKSKQQNDDIVIFF